VEVRADAPGAIMRVYGHSYPLPFHGALERSAAPVEVEITAPGREGRLYGVLLEQGQRLRATLPPGDGVKRATDEESARALGR
jgi:hypothetical protein